MMEEKVPEPSSRKSPAQSPVQRLLERGVYGHVYDEDPAIQVLFAAAQHWHDLAISADRAATERRQEAREAEEDASACGVKRDKVLAAITWLQDNARDGSGTH